MRIFFIGTVEFSLSALTKLVEMGADVVGVASKKQSQFNADYADLAIICERNHIPIFYPENVNSAESVSVIRELKPDVIYCFGWSSLIKDELLSIPHLGVVGFHPARLPMNRGRHPIIWALALGLEETASTFFFMDTGADSGPILSQVIIPIEYGDDARLLYNKITKVALIQIENFTQSLTKGEFEKKEQRHELSNSWRKRDLKDGCVDFRMSSRAIYNLVRALTKPYIGAHVEFDGLIIKIWKVEECKSDLHNLECGKVIESTGNMFVVKTYDGAIRVVEHEFINIPSLGSYL